MEKREGSAGRCQACRYWFERCCHALALQEGNHHHPPKCMHFVSDMTPPVGAAGAARPTAP
jgi:hypothetical protein